MSLWMRSSFTHYHKNGDGHEPGDLNPERSRVWSEWLPIRTLTRLVWAPFLPGRRWRRSPGRWLLPWPRWWLPFGRILLIIFASLSLLLLGLFDLLLHDLQFRDDIARKFLKGSSRIVMRLGKCQDRSVGRIQRFLFWSSRTLPDWRTSQSGGATIGLSASSDFW